MLWTLLSSFLSFQPSIDTSSYPWIPSIYRLLPLFRSFPLTDARLCLWFLCLWGALSCPGACAGCRLAGSLRCGDTVLLAAAASALLLCLTHLGGGLWFWLSAQLALGQDSLDPRPVKVSPQQSFTFASSENLELNGLERSFNSSTWISYSSLVVMWTAHHCVYNLVFWSFMADAFSSSPRIANGFLTGFPSFYFPITGRAHRTSSEWGAEATTLTPPTVARHSVFCSVHRRGSRLYSKGDFPSRLLTEHLEISLFPFYLRLRKCRKYISVRSLMPCVLIIFTLLDSSKISPLPTHPTLSLIPPHTPHQVQFVLPIYSWMCSFPLECGQLTTDNTDWLFLSPQVSIALARCGTSGPLLLSMPGFGLQWVCPVLRRLVQWMWVQFACALPCCVSLKDTVPLCSTTTSTYPLPLTLPLFHNDTWAFGGGLWSYCPI